MAPSSNTEEVSTDMKQKFCTILKKHGILDEVDEVIMFNPPELKGEHMATATVYVTVTFKNPKTPRKNLFVKKFTDNAMHTEAVKLVRLMEKESAFFNDFLPTAQEFCRNYPGCENLLNFFPKFLYGDDEMVVLENHVLDDGFVMLPKEDQQDFETAKHVVGNLARFHASSFAIIETCGRDTFPSKWELVCSEALINDKNPYAKGLFDNGISTCISILKSSSLDNAEAILSKLSSFIGQSYKLVQDCIEIVPEDKLLVVNHGDCWNNNMLFKIDSSNGKKKIDEHMFVDLQITRLGSPNLDIVYFLYSSVKAGVRRNHLKDFLMHYYQIFSSTVNTLGLECPWTFGEFFEDYKKRVAFGFFVNLNFLSMIGAMKGLDVHEMGATPEEMMASFNKIVANWIENNPEKVADISKEVVAVLEEFSTLTKTKLTKY